MTTTSTTGIEQSTTVPDNHRAILFSIYKPQCSTEQTTVSNHVVSILNDDDDACDGVVEGCKLWGKWH